MGYVKFAAYHVPMLHVHQCLTKHGFTLFSQQNRHANNLSSIVLIGQFCAHIIIGISILFEAFDEIHQVFLDGIGENMASLVQSGMYDKLNIDDTITNRFYVIKFLSYAYTLQNNTTIYGQVISARELVVKAQYLCSIQENTNWYWKQ